MHVAAGERITEKLCSLLYDNNNAMLFTVNDAARPPSVMYA